MAGWNGLTPSAQDPGTGNAYLYEDTGALKYRGTSGSAATIINADGTTGIGVVGPTGPAGADGADGADGVGVPTGGTTGQVLAKATTDDYDTEWVDVESLPTQTGNAGELLVTNGTNASWSNTVTANNSATPALVVQALSGQINNLVEYKNSSGSIIGGVGAQGQLYVTGTSPNSTQVIVKGASGQTSNLQEWKDSSNITLANVGSGGKLTAIPAGPSNATSASNVGYVGMPQVSNPSSPYILSASDAGKHIYMTTTGGTITIPANISVPLEVGTTITIVNGSAVSTTISINTDTLYLAGSGSIGSRTLAAFGVATAIKISSTAWIISGNGLS